ncbi:uncharacterized protein A4U43_C07F26840 [Asparagus officinalis]|uniref:U-box domain-containing protein n=1 Tax=Asparagus officinalis TaxID=4686 RepID=A0A5P1EF90_ASPOF|nr:uncharacterized protein A4U43_C07F26840 [Asparagus officinalis]
MRFTKVRQARRFIEASDEASLHLKSRGTTLNYFDFFSEDLVAGQPNRSSSWSVSSSPSFNSMVLNIHDEFCCPITLDLMKDPVIRDELRDEKTKLRADKTSFDAR